MGAMTRAMFGVAALAALALPATAQEWPAKQVNFIVPFSAGGTTDLFGRLLAQHMQKNFDKPFIVENRAGAGGNIGASMVAKAAPDGYTFLVGTVSTHAINPFLYSKMPHDTVKDFQPVSLIARLPNLLVVHPSLPARNVQELIALAKAKPNSIDYASSGNGSSQHLVGALFCSMAGVKLNHVPYKGSNQAMNDVIGGQVKVSFVGVPNALPNLNSGKLKALGVSTAKRYAELPDVPTIAEAGVPGYDATIWLGLLAPPGTPREIVQKLNADISRILSTPDARKLMASAGVDVATSTPEDFGRLMQSELDRWGKVVRETGATVN